jgi:signal transduction histidine kinase
MTQQNIHVELSLFSGLPVIEGSKDKLKQVFLNLFLNARDAMPNGGTLTVETFKRNGSVVARVTDTGIGIPPENIHRVFDAFFTTKSNLSGVGLGLSVTYGIVRQHGGSITAESTQGKGAVFHLTFPVKEN